MRRDQLILGNCLKCENLTLLRAINAGRRGFISTLHANPPQGAFEQVTFMGMQTRLGHGRRETMEHAQSMIDVVIQLDHKSGRRAINGAEFGYSGSR